MHKGLLLSIGFFLTTFSFAQSLVGTVYEKEKDPAEYAMVRLFTVMDSTVVKGAFTDEAGKFQIENIPSGTYRIVITLLNYKDFELIKTFNADESVDLGALRLERDETINLDEVVASGSLDVLKAGIDKKVYSVEEDLTSKGGTVNDILNNIPSIEVDQDGNISLRGDGNVTILIDGRPSALAPGDGQNLLDALPANSVERIEVVTNPSAKYDPDGTSGIINIVLKRNKIKGFNGVISATAATGNLYEGNLGLSYRTQKFNLYGNYSLNYYEGYRNYFSQLELDINTDSTTLLDQQRQGTDLKSTNTVLVGFDWYITERNIISVSGSGSFGRRVRKGDLVNRFYPDEVTLDNRWDRTSFDPRKLTNFDVNLNYTREFKERKGAVTFNANHTSGRNLIEGFYEQRYYDANEELLNKAFLEQQLENHTSNTITTAQLDYNYIFSKIKARVEGGTKAIINSEYVDTYSETRDTITGIYMEDTVANFEYKYDAQVYSLYGVFGQELDKFKYQIGLRGEYALQVPNLISTGERYPNTYLNLFPSGHVRYAFSKSSELSLSYSRRINRPGSGQLNPFTSYANPVSLQSGNPELQPEYIDSYDLGYSLNKKKLNLSFSVFHRRTKDVINRVKEYYPNNTAVVTYANIDKSISTGFETVIIYKPVTRWKNSLSANGNYINYINSDTTVDWSNTGFNWSIKFMSAIEFWKNTMSVQLNAQYNAPRVTPQGIVQPRMGIDLSINKMLFKKQFTITARVTDIFNTRGFYIDLDQEGVRQTSHYKWLTRRFYLTLSYKIGKYQSDKNSGGSAGGGDDF